MFAIRIGGLGGRGRERLCGAGGALYNFQREADTVV